MYPKGLTSVFSYGVMCAKLKLKSQDIKKIRSCTKTVYVNKYPCSCPNLKIVFLMGVPLYLAIFLSYAYIGKSDYGRDIAQSHIADQPTTPLGRATEH